ncbi:hypothetical protein D3C78_1464910 [compost metagenome]
MDIQLQTGLGKAGLQHLGNIGIRRLVDDDQINARTFGNPGVMQNLFGPGYVELERLVVDRAIQPQRQKRLVNTVLPLQQVVGNGLIVHQPARRLPQGWVAQRRRLFAAGVEAEIIDFGRVLLLYPDPRLFTQRIELIGTQVVSHVGVSFQQQQAPGSGIADVLQQHRFYLRLRLSVVVPTE